MKIKWPSSCCLTATKRTIVLAIVFGLAGFLIGRAVGLWLVGK
jgi:hypothetical protein